MNNNQSEIPQILKQESQPMNGVNQNEYKDIKKIIKQSYLVAASLSAVFICIFSMITSNIIPGAFMGEWLSTNAHEFMAFSFISVAVLVFIFLLVTIVYYFKVKNSKTWNYMNSLILEHSENGSYDVNDSNSSLDRSRTALYGGMALNAMGNLLDNDLMSDLGSVGQGYAVFNLIEIMKKRAQILEKKFKLNVSEKFISKLPIIISWIYVIIMVIIGINAANVDKGEILSGRYDTISSIVSTYSDLGAQVYNNYSYDQVNKTYDDIYATVVMSNGDEIDFSMVNSSKITDDIEYIINYNGVTLDNLNNIVNDFTSRTITLQNRASNFKDHVKDPRQVEALMSFDDYDKQGIVNEINSSIQENSDIGSYDIIQHISDHIYYQTTYIKIEPEVSGTYAITFRTVIRAKEW